MQKLGSGFQERVGVPDPVVAVGDNKCIASVVDIDGDASLVLVDPVATEEDLLRGWSSVQVARLGYEFVRVFVFVIRLFLIAQIKFLLQLNGILAYFLRELTYLTRAIVQDIGMIINLLFGILNLLLLLTFASSEHFLGLSLIFFTFIWVGFEQQFLRMIAMIIGMSILFAQNFLKNKIW